MIGFNGVLEDCYHNFTARASNKVSLYRLKKETLKHLQNVCEDLFKSVGEAKLYYRKEPIPYVDFCMPKLVAEGTKPIHILKLAVSRLLRINRNLNRFSHATEILSLLRELQKKYNSPSKITKPDDTHKKTLELIETMMIKFEAMKEELYDQRMMLRAQTLRNPPNPAANRKAKFDDYVERMRTSQPMLKTLPRSPDNLGLDSPSRALIKEIELSALDEDEISKNSNES